MVSRVKFYKNGLNSNNWAFDRAAHVDIINNTQIGAELLSAPLAFGAVFNISNSFYEQVKTATYLSITNDSDTRYGFINNFLQLANGNWAVSYSLDDWANYFLNLDFPESKIDADVIHGHVPLLQYEKETFATKMANYLVDNTERESHNDKITYVKLSGGVPVGGELMTEKFYQGYTCEVYWLLNPKNNGAPTDYLYTGNYIDYDVESETLRTFRRLNTNMVFMIYDADGYNIPVVGMDGSIIYEPRTFNRREINSDSIIKRMVFDFLPFNTSDRFILGSYAGVYRYALRRPVFGYGGADIFESRTGDNSYTYYQGCSVNDFAPCVKTVLSDDNTGDIVINGQTTIFNKALEYTPQAVNLKFKYLGAEILIPATEIKTGTTLITSISADGETAILRLSGLKNQAAYNSMGAYGVNSLLINMALKTDYFAYRNAKISGALGLGATVAGSVVALGSSIATGNVAGVVGALSGGITGAVGTAQKLKGLSPTKNAPGTNDEITALILNDGLYMIATQTGGQLGVAEKRDLNKFGFDINVEFDWYKQYCQMSHFNFIKCQNINVYNVPEQIANKISDALALGVTLWSVTDVGNKDVVNIGIFPTSLEL